LNRRGERARDPQSLTEQIAAHPPAAHNDAEAERRLVSCGWTRSTGQESALCTIGEAVNGHLAQWIDRFHRIHGICYVEFPSW